MSARVRTFRRVCGNWSGLLLLCWPLAMGSLAAAPPSEAKPIRMLTLENPPLEFTNADGEVTGIVVDLIHEASKRTNREVTIQIYPWKRVINEVAKGNADGAFNAGKTLERQSWGRYHSTALIDETFVFFARQPLALSPNLEEASQLDVGTQLGYFYGERFEQIVRDSPFKSMLEVSTIEHNLRLLMGRRTDVFIGDLLPTLYYIKALGLEGQIHIVREKASGKPLTVSVSPTYVAFSRKTVDQAYVDRFNQALDEIKADGTYSRIFDRYGLESQLP